MSERPAHVLARLALLSLIAAAHGAAGADLLEQLNSLRTNGCGTMEAVEGALRWDPTLDAAARKVADGAGLQDAANASGYPARRVARIHVQGPGGGDLRELLERQFCHLLGDPELADVGLFERNSETWIVLAAPFALPEGTSTVTAADRLFAVVNDARSRERRCAGQSFDSAGALRRTKALDDAALAHAQDIAARGDMGHEGSDGSTVSGRVERAGYAWVVVGENVAAGQSTAEEVVDTWLASPGHCRNLMDPRFSETGAAVALNRDDDRVIYWVQVYASPGEARD